MLMANLTGWLRLYGMSWHELDEINEVLSCSVQTLRKRKALISELDHYKDISGYAWYSKWSEYAKSMWFMQLKLPKPFQVGEKKNILVRIAGVITCISYVTIYLILIYDTVIPLYQYYIYLYIHVYNLYYYISVIKQYVCIMYVSIDLGGWFWWSFQLQLIYININLQLFFCFTLYVINKT